MQWLHEIFALYIGYAVYNVMYMYVCMYVYLFGSKAQDTIHEIIHIRIYV